jgi:endonuclease IV
LPTQREFLSLTPVKIGKERNAVVSTLRTVNKLINMITELSRIMVCLYISDDMKTIYNVCNNYSSEIADHSGRAV